jgi:hypothetical protein
LTGKNGKIRAGTCKNALGALDRKEDVVNVILLVLSVSSGWR